MLWSFRIATRRLLLQNKIHYRRVGIRPPQSLKIVMAPDGAINREILFVIKVGYKELGNPRWGFLLFHEFNIAGIAELTWEFCYPTAGYTDKVYIL